MPAPAARPAASSCARPITRCATRRPDLLGKRLVTIQTGPEGKPVQRVYIEVAEPFERELYLGYVLDRKAERIRVIASQRGGMEIEEIAKDRARGDPAGGGRAGGRPAGIPGARARLPARPQHQAGRSAR